MFEGLKAALTSVPVLAPSDFSKPFTIQYNISGMQRCIFKLEAKERIETVPKGYPKRQKFFERQKHLEQRNQSHVEVHNRVHLEKWPKGAVSKYRGEMIVGRAARKEELF